MTNLSKVLYQSIENADRCKRRMWLWIWTLLLRSVPKSELRKMLRDVETAATELDKSQKALIELAFKAEAIEQLLGE